jgi:hypothetical protein
MTPRGSWANANNPYCSSRVESWRGSNQDAEEYCGRRKFRWRGSKIGCAISWPGRLAQTVDELQNLRKDTAEHQRKTEQPKRRKSAVRYRYSVRTDCGLISLRASRSMHVEASNSSDIGHAEHAAALDLRRMRCADRAIVSK